MLLKSDLENFYIKLIFFGNIIRKDKINSLAFLQLKRSIHVSKITHIFGCGFRAVCESWDHNEIIRDIQSSLIIKKN